MGLEGVTTKLVKYPKGGFIFKKDEFTRDLFIVHSGKIRVLKQVGMRTIVLTELGKGSVFGEVAAIDGGPRSATVQTLEDTEVFIITPQEFKSKTTPIPEWFMKIVRILVQRLRETDKRIELDGGGNSEYNVILLLSYLVAGERKEGEQSVTLNLKATQNELVELLRIQFRDLTEILDSLKEQSIIDLKQDQLIIPDVGKLEESARSLEKQITKAISF